MKKLLYLLLLITLSVTAQDNNIISKPLVLTNVVQGTKADSLLVRGTDKKVKYIPRSVFLAGISGGGATEETYSQLQSLVSSNGLEVGKTYLLTDYMTTYNQPETGVFKASGVIEPLYLTAATSNSFINTAYSALYPQDIIYYDVDGDIDDGHGVEGFTKGKIYRRIDTENNNDIGTDWRFVKYDRSGVDKKLFESYGDVYDNVIKGTRLMNTVSEDNFHNNNIGSGFYNNDIGNDFYNNDIGNDFYNNDIGDYCYNNDIGNDFYNNDIGDYCYGNVLGWGFNYNIISNYFSSNVIASETNGNTITSDFQANNIGYNMYSNTFQDSVYNNKIGTGFNNNVVNYFDNNVIGDGFYNNTIESDFFANKVGNYFNGNDFDFNSASNNTIGDGFSNNSISQGFYNNDIGNDFYNNNLLSSSYNFEHNKIGNVFQNNNILANFSRSIFTSLYTASNTFDFVENMTVSNEFSGNDLTGVLVYNNQFLVANLPTSVGTGQEFWVTNSSTPVLGAIVTSGGTNLVKVVYNGVNWVYATGGGGGGCGCETPEIIDVLNPSCDPEDQPLVFTSKNVVVNVRADYDGTPTSVNGGFLLPPIAGTQGTKIDFIIAYSGYSNTLRFEPDPSDGDILIGTNSTTLDYYYYVSGKMVVTVRSNGVYWTISH